MFQSLIKPKEVFMLQVLKVVPPALIVLSFCFFISALASNAQGQMFAPAVNYPVGDEPFHTFAADYDNDGDIDLSTANSAGAMPGSSGSVSILLNNGDGTFALDSTYGPFSGAPLSTHGADFDKDGDFDLAVPLPFNAFSDSLAILFNNGDGTFAAPVYYGAGDGPNYSFAADYDNDGDQDLALTHTATPAVINETYIFLNDGAGAFVLDSIYPGGNEHHDVYSADFEPDGDKDLVIVNHFADSIQIRLNNGDATFAAAVNYRVGDGPNSVFSADFNNDGFFDVVVANIFTNNISILMNKGDGTGTFEAAVNYGAGGRGVAVSSADYDIDGDFDLSVANGISNTVSILLNNGSGTFVLDSSYGAGARTFRVFSADFDNDGDIDVVATNRDGDNVSILKNLTTLVIGQPKISMLPDTLDFGNVFVGHPETLKVTVRNLGFPDTLDVSNIGSDNLDFSPGVTTFSLPGASARRMNVVFNPSTAGAISANLIFSSNDPTNSTDSVVMRGTVCAARKGDMNGSGNLSGADIVLLLRCVFNQDGTGTAGGDCNLCYSDVNCSGDLSGADIVLELLAIFNQQPFPC